MKTHLLAVILGLAVIGPTGLAQVTSSDRVGQNRVTGEPVVADNRSHEQVANFPWIASIVVVTGAIVLLTTLYVRRQRLRRQKMVLRDIYNT